MQLLTHSYQVHKNLSCHWGGEFRPDMLTMPASIRAQTVDPQNIPVLAMTATLTPDEGKEVEKELCIDSEKVRVRKSHCNLKMTLRLVPCGLCAYCTRRSFPMQLFYSFYYLSDNFRQLSGIFMASFWQLSGNSLVTLWLLSANFFFATFGQLFCNVLYIFFLQLSVNFLATFWQLPGNFFDSFQVTFWPISGKFLAPLWHLSFNFLATL